ncbi:RIP metalloprotease RseP [Vagococcus fluvialis]|uniref:Zinc metalloprotease n=1 Tax=Vagococcus fluvialis TaxID=2738 RepID=A0A430AB29_9ENTE|nr:RIP metalloprotease RseP [Vagococcus fluvialis]MBO0480209.1 RIP metalloprotease RseP [Vagococcus fluvialis]MBO0485008.1 RIP metalloprotease RseP [Vagococcus fluvialis]MCM2139964.1 RIP metalloprotease RseP [Vagococcus fluvialis]MDT2747463.1 RIP metalloprotease RseP [Vagococcus fluvialis]RSU04444.1 RIP metalloprotease RseP [Vagococcus fluvialis]
MSTIVTFIFVFGIIVLVHEFGHFIFAKRGGILVREFAIGMGPKLFHHRKNETTYTIRMLPIGGYVRMAGEGEEEVELAPGMPVSLVLDENGVVVKINPNKKVQLPNSIPVEVIKHDLVDDLYITGFENGDDSLEKRFTVAHDATIIEEDGLETQIAPRDVQFQSASLGRRMMTNFAGPMNNFILSFILFTIVAFMLGGSYKPDNSSTIGGVVQDGVAQKAGIKAGEKIIEANGKKIETFNELSEVITPNVGKKVTLVVEDSNKKTRNVDVTPVESAEGTKQGIIGIQSGTVLTELSFFEKIKYGITETFANSLMIFKALGNLVTDFSLNKLGGPVMIFKASEAVSNSGFIAILSFTAMLSVNLGIMNLIPIPGLDGGKLALNIFEGVRGKPLSQEKEVMITMIGVGILLLLMIAVTWNDIQRFFIR